MFLKYSAVFGQYLRQIRNYVCIQRRLGGVCSGDIDEVGTERFEQIQPLSSDGDTCTASDDSRSRRYSSIDCWPRNQYC